jgi:hypothetical protein
MNSMPSFRHSQFEERLRFEMLLTEVSARFVSATSESIDAEIVSPQKQIVQELGLDRSTLAQLHEPDRFVVTHCLGGPRLGTDTRNCGQRDSLVRKCCWQRKRGAPRAHRRFVRRSVEREGDLLLLWA